VTQEQAKARTRQSELSAQTKIANSYYAILNLHPSASVLEIRRSYRHLSKQYHPDTTELAKEQARVEFQKLNEAYAVLSNPEKRSLYDLKIGYSRFNVIQAPPDRDREQSWKSSAYLDPHDRPLSSGEIFVLFVLGLTFLGCILLAIAIALFREHNFHF
jgi:DnaJ-domain-containing protein 1